MRLFNKIRHASETADAKDMKCQVKLCDSGSKIYLKNKRTEYKIKTADVLNLLLEPMIANETAVACFMLPE